METYRSQALNVNRIIRQLALEWIQSEWVAVELKFEALAQGVSCRADVAMHCLKQDKVINDDALDQYNERISRFTN